MKSRLRTYDRGFQDGTNSTIDLLMAVFVVVISDHTALTETEVKRVSEMIDLYAGQIIAGELTLGDIKEVSTEILN